MHTCCWAAMVRRQRRMVASSCGVHRRTLRCIACKRTACLGKAHAFACSCPWAESQVVSCIMHEEIPCIPAMFCSGSTASY